MFSFSIWYGEGDRKYNNFTYGESSGHLTRDLFHGLLMDMMCCAHYFETDVELRIDTGKVVNCVFLTLDKSEESGQWWGFYHVDDHVLPIRCAKVY